MKGKEKNQKRKRFSLQWGLLGIVVTCWLLPMIVLIFILTFYTSSSIKRQFDEATSTSVRSAAHFARNTMQIIVTASRYASYEGTISEAYNSYKLTGNKQQLFNDVNRFLVRQYRFDNNIITAITYFCDEPDRMYDTGNPSFPSPYMNVIKYRMDVHDKAQKIAETLDTKIAFYSYDKSLYMIRNIVDKNYKPIAVLVLILNIGNVFNAFENIVWQTDVALYLNGTEFINKADNIKSNLKKPNKYLFEPGTFIITDKEDKALIEGRESIDGLDILYAVMVDRKSMMGGFDNFVGIFYLLLALLFPLLAFVIWYFYKNILGPITILNSAARNIQNGQLGMQIIESAPNKEFEYLNKTFNNMSVRLKKQFEQSYSEELALRDARIMALQSQINPHFLNNTLEIINWESRLGNNAKVSRMIEALATMLDAAMDRKNLPVVPLHQELMYLDAYLYIISERFGKRLSVTKEIDTDLLQCFVPRLIMQPITENAVEHGVARLQKGQIIIRVKKNEDKSELILEVENNGNLTDADRKSIEKLLAPDYDARNIGMLHLGIHNVNMRLKMIYGEKVKLEIVGNKNNTISKINIPLKVE